MKRTTGMAVTSDKVYFKWDTEKGRKIEVGVPKQTVKTGLPVLIKNIPKKPVRDLVIYEMKAEEFKVGWPEVKIKKGWTHDLASNKHW